MMSKLRQLFKGGFLWFVCGLALSAAAHGINMFNYPYFENDEGTYLSQGYAVAYEGKITHYTYWYDHVPFGWFLIAAWLRLTGGPFTFGFSLNSGRILMWLMQLGSATLLFLILRKLGVKAWLAAVGMLIFSVSPIALYFHRRLLIDNIMTFWLLASLVALLWANKRLSWVLASSLLFMTSVLTKENAIFALPGYLWVINQVMDKRQRLVAWLCFIGPVFIGGFYFIFYALLKRELFPGQTHASLIGTWTYHLSRGSKEPFWSPTSDFYGAFRDWLSKDFLLMIAICISSLWLLIKSGADRLNRSISIIGICLWLFVIRGGLVINFYVVPLLAFGTLTLVLWLEQVRNWHKWGNALVWLIIIVWLTTQRGDAWFANETWPQLQATEWIKQQLPSDAVVAVDHSHLIDLQQSRWEGDPALLTAHWFWKLDRDPEIQAEVLQYDWKQIEYVALTHEFLKQLKENNLPYINPVYTYSTPIASWGPLSSGTHINLNQKISTNGDWVKILRRYDYIETLLADSWMVYVKNFISAEGQVLDPQSNKTTSEGQAYALLRSVIANDETTFAVVLNWTTSHLQNRQGDALFSWWWGETEEGVEGVVDAGWATDADIDIATALILASRKWQIPEYEDLARIIVSDIWKQSVFELDGEYYLIAGTWAQYGNYITINPSYFSPAAYRLFAEIDTDHEWLTMVDDTYAQLELVSEVSSVDLPADWLDVDKTTQQFSLSRRPNLSQIYSYDAMRTYWRIAQDYYWFKSPEALDYLQSQNFLPEYWQQNNRLASGYRLNGSVVNNYEDNSFYGAWLPAVKITHPSIYKDVYSKLQAQHRESTWAPVDNYYAQNWIYLGIALSEEKFMYIPKENL